MTCTASTPRSRSLRLASHARCQSPLSRCRSTKNLKRSNNRNQQYSITAITDGSGGIVERYAYTAYGTPTITDASGTTRTTTAVGNRYSYTGREWDETLALFHYRARIYDSVGGRFVGRDPIEFTGSKWSLYEYVSSMPLDTIDPTGLLGEPSIGRWVLVKTRRCVLVVVTSPLTAAGCATAAVTYPLGQTYVRPWCTDYFYRKWESGSDPLPIPYLDRNPHEPDPNEDERERRRECEERAERAWKAREESCKGKRTREQVRRCLEDALQD